MKNILLKTSLLFYVASMVFTFAAITTTVRSVSAAKVVNNLFSISNSPESPLLSPEPMRFGFNYENFVYVSNIEELYSAVNNPNNAGSQIVIAPGVYMLSANAPGGAARPNRGRLELQENMSLLGVQGDREAVVIDAFNLPVSSYQTPALTGAIRIGRGSNTIEWLTVRRAVNGSANIETDLIWSGTAYIRIAHIASTGSVRGIDVRNFGPEAAGAVIEAEIVDNDLFSNRLRLAEGIRIGNNLGANGSVIFATLSGNRIFDNFQGLLVENNRANSANISVFSSGDRFFENGSGTNIIGGLSFNSIPANGNTINFTAHGSIFENNNGFASFDRGGMSVVGGENLSIPNGTSNNTVNVELQGCRFANNQLYDIAAFGARTDPFRAHPDPFFFRSPPGTNNHVVITLRGIGRNQPPINIVTADSIPKYRNDMNTVTIIR